MRLCFKLFLVSNLFINFSHGQTGTGRSANYLTGQVQTTEGFTLPGVVVAVIRKDSSLVKVVLSDSSGRFTLPALPAGSFILRSSMMGYKTAYQALQVNDSTSTQFYKLILEPLAVNLSEVKVKERRPLYELVGDRIILNLASDALFAGGYAYDAL